MTAVYANELRETRPYLLVWQGHRLTLDALTGQRGTLIRNASQGSSWDSFGAGLTVVRDRPCWGFPAGHPQAGLQTNTNTIVHWGDWNLPPVDCCGLIEFRELSGGTIGIADAGIFSLTADAGVPARGLWIAATAGGRYTAVFHNGTSAVSSTYSTAAPGVGDLVRLRWRLRSAGGSTFIRLWQQTGIAAEQAAAESSGVTSVGTWLAGTKPRLNGMGNANRGAVGFYNCVIARGDLSQAQLLEAVAA